MSWNCNKGEAQTRHTHTACYVSGVLSNRCCQMLNSGENVWGWGVGVGVLKQKDRLIPYKTSNEDSGLHSILST